MYIKLFIKTIDEDKATEVVEELLSFIDAENIKYKNIKTEQYWKFDDVTAAEIKLELFRSLQGEDKENFLKSISNKWLYFSEEEVLSSAAMNDCKLNYNLEMANIFFS